MALFKTVLIHILILATANIVFTQSSYEDVQNAPSDGGPPARHDEGIEENDGREMLDEQETFGPREGYEDQDGMIADQTQPNGQDPQSRLFCSLLGSTFTTCNFTRQAGRTCTACRRTLTCFRSNVGIARTCRGLFRYCRNGRCSLFPGAACSAAATTAAAAATTAAVGTTAAGTTQG